MSNFVLRFLLHSVYIWKLLRLHKTKQNKTKKQKNKKKTKKKKKKKNTATFCTRNSLETLLYTTSVKLYALHVTPSPLLPFVIRSLTETYKRESLFFVLNGKLIISRSTLKHIKTETVEECCCSQRNAFSGIIKVKR